MTTPSAAARHVVERCPACGVEHDVSANSVCEACHAPLRLWCSRHGREAGWLDNPNCPRCAEEVARPTPWPRAPALPCPDVTRGTAPSPAASAGAAPLDRKAAKAAEAAERMRSREARHQLAVLISIMLVTTGGGAMLGAIVGSVYVLAVPATNPLAASWLTLWGAVLGVVLGARKVTRGWSAPWLGVLIRRPRLYPPSTPSLRAPFPTRAPYRERNEWITVIGTMIVCAIPALALTISRGAQMDQSFPEAVLAGLAAGAVAGLPLGWVISEVKQYANRRRGGREGSE